MMGLDVTAGVYVIAPLFRNVTVGVYEIAPLFQIPPWK